MLMCLSAALRRRDFGCSPYLKAAAKATPPLQNTIENMEIISTIFTSLTIYAQFGKLFRIY